MEPNQNRGLSSATFLIVTGLCFLFFGKILQLLDHQRIPFFTWTGLTGLVGGSLTSIFVGFTRKG